MTTDRWPQIRLIISAVLLIGMGGEWIYILLQPSSELDSPPTLQFVYPTQVPIPGWQLELAKPLPVKDQAQAPGYLYQYSRRQETVKIQVYGQKNGNGNVSRYLMLYGFAPPATALLTIKQQPQTGYSALTHINSQAYLSACLNPVGESTVTPAQFTRNLNRYGWSLERAFGWLLGWNDFRDARCFWTILSTAVDETGDSKQLTVKYAMLNSVWQNWYQWWKLHLKESEFQL
jgi:cyanosortase A-associated protein